MDITTWRICVASVIDLNPQRPCQSGNFTSIAETLNCVNTFLWCTFIIKNHLTTYIFLHVSFFICALNGSMPLIPVSLFLSTFFPVESMPANVGCLTALGFLRHCLSEIRG